MIYNDDKQIKMNIKHLITYCIKLKPYMAFYNMQINAHNKTAPHILKNEVDLILPKFPEGRKSKRGIFSVISGALHIIHLKIQIGQVKTGMEQRLRQRKRQGRLTYCWIEIYLNLNLNPITQQM